MNKFKSLILFSFLCVGSQCGFYSETCEATVTPQDRIAKVEEQNNANKEILEDMQAGILDSGKLGPKEIQEGIGRTIEHSETIEKVKTDPKKFDKDLKNVEKDAQKTADKLCALL